MEPLIVALILMAVSAFFGKKKKDETPSSSQKPVRSEPYSRSRSQGGFKRMEDYAKEIYGEFQSQMNPELDKKEQVKEAAKQTAKQVVERHAVKERQPTNREKIRESAIEATSVASGEIGGRLSPRQKTVRPARQTVQEDDGKMFPLTQDEAQKAIILAEVFMPPKSKRR